MISVRSGLRILVAASPVDFRRGMDSLAMLVTDTLRGDPFLCLGRDYVAEGGDDSRGRPCRDSPAT
jgi:hypothetical protein